MSDSDSLFTAYVIESVNSSSRQSFSLCDYRMINNAGHLLFLKKICLGEKMLIINCFQKILGKENICYKTFIYRTY